MRPAKQRAFSRQAKQLKIDCQDRPGTLSKLAKLLGESDVKYRGNELRNAWRARDRPCRRR